MKRFLTFVFVAFVSGLILWSVRGADGQLQNVSGTTTLGAAPSNAVTNSGTLTANVVIGDGARGIVNGAATGAVPINADGSATTFPKIQALAPGVIITNGGTTVFTYSNNIGTDASHYLTLVPGMLGLKALSGVGSVVQIDDTTGSLRDLSLRSQTNSGNIQSATLNTTGAAVIGGTLNSGSMTSSGNLIAGQFNEVRWANVSRMQSPSDGVITMWNNAQTDFNRLQFGGTTAAFPSLKRSGGDVKLSDGPGTGTTNNWFVPGVSTSTNGFASYATNATMTTTATGCTNGTVINQIIYVTAATGASLTDNAGTTEFSSVTITAFTPIRMQPNGKFVGTAITYAAGTESHAE